MTWICRSRYWMAKKPTMPGVRRLRDGGWLVRRRVSDPKTGRQAEITRVFDADVPAMKAYEWLQAETDRIRHGRDKATEMRTRFRSYATSLLSQKINAGNIWSPKGVEKWKYTLDHHLFPYFGDMFVELITAVDVSDWHGKVSSAILKGDMSAASANTHLYILRQILPIQGKTVRSFRTPPGRETYTDENPNSLKPEDVPRFTGTMHDLFPQHYAIVVVGFALGLRPSSLRPLRRCGPNTDLIRNPDGTGRLLVRRSQTLGDAVERTKTGRKQSIAIPKQLVAVLDTHIANFNIAQRESDLLFPSDIGGYRSGGCLDKPFTVVGKEMGLAYRLTPRAMRRTSQDVRRANEVSDIVMRSISGWTTETMPHHYSTVSDKEQIAAVEKSFASVVRAPVIEVVEFPLNVVRDRPN